MAKTYETKLKVTADGKGIKGTTQQVEKLGKANKRAAASMSDVSRENHAVGGNVKNSTANFAKQAQGLGGLVHVYATIAANVFALGAAYEVLKRSADLSILEEASTSLSAHLGVNLKRVAESLKEVTGGALGFKEAMQNTNIALAGGIDASGLEELTKVATKAAAMTGRSVPDAVNRLTQAVIKAEPELVDEFGIILRVQKATDDYAKTLGKTAKELTTAERSQAILNQVLERGGKITAGIKLEKSVNAFTRLSTAVVELSQKIGQFFSSALGPLAKFLTDNTGLLVVGFLGAVGILGKQLFPLFTNFSESVTSKTTTATAAMAAQLAVQKQQIMAMKEEHILLAASGKERAKQASSVLSSFGTGKQVLTKAKKREGSLPSELGKSLASKTSVIGKATAKLADEYSDSFGNANEEVVQSFEWMGQEINRVQAAALVELRHGALKNGTDIRGSLDITSVMKRNAAAIKIAALQMKTYSANMKIAIADSFAYGTQSGFIGSIKEIGFTFDYFSSAASETGAKFSRLRGVVASVSSVMGGMVSTIFKAIPIVGQLIFAWEIISSLLSGIVGWLDLTTEHYSKALKEQEKLQEASKESLSISVLMAQAVIEVSDNFSDLVLDVKRLNNATKESVAEMTKFLEISDKLNQGSSFEKGWEGFKDFLPIIDGAGDKFDKTFDNILIGNSIRMATISKQAKAAGLDIQESFAITLPNGVYEKTKSQFRDNFITPITADVDVITVHVKNLQEVFEILGNSVISKEVKTNIITQMLDQMKGTQSVVDENAQAMQRLDSVLETSNKRFVDFSNTLSKSTVFTPIIKDLQNTFAKIQDVTKEQRDAFFKDNKEFVALGIRSIEGVRTRLVALVEKQKDLLSIKSLISETEALIKLNGKGVSEGSISAIKEETRLNKVLAEQKDKQFAQELAQDTLIYERQKQAEKDNPTQVAISHITKASIEAKEAAYKLKKQLDELNTLPEALRVLLAERKSTQLSADLDISKVKGKLSVLAKITKSLDENSLSLYKHRISLKNKEYELTASSHKSSIVSLEKEIKLYGTEETLKGKLLTKSQLALKLQKEKNAQALTEVNYIALQIEQQEKLIALRLKTINQDTIFSPEGMKAVGDSLVVELRKFSKGVLSAGERFKNAMVNGLDAAVDSFTETFDKWVTGEGSLKDVFRDMGRSMIDAMREQSLGMMSDNLKKAGREFLTKLFPGSGDMFKTLDEQLLSATNKIVDNTAGLPGGAGKTSKSPIENAAKEALQKLANTGDDINEETGVIEKALSWGKDIFERGFGAIGDILSEGAHGLAQGINNLMASMNSGGGGSGIFSTILQGAIGMVTGGFTGGFGNSSASILSGSAYGTNAFSAQSNALWAQEMLWAKGGIPGGTGISQHSNTVVDTPTMFASGAGIMGEAGPEAIMPLTRMPGGNLGVEANGAKSSSDSNIVNIVINYEDNGGAGDKESETSDQNKQDSIAEFGHMIAGKVRQELIQQKRPGGLLA